MNKAIKRETARHRKAYIYYLTIGLLEGRRTHKMVAEKFGVSVETIKKWSSSFHWKDRIVQSEKEISERFLDKSDDEILQALRFNLNLVRDLKQRFREKFDKQEVLGIGDISDLDKVLKLERLLFGEHTDNIKNEITIKVNRVITDQTENPLSS